MGGGCEAIGSFRVPVGVESFRCLEPLMALSGILKRHASRKLYSTAADNAGLFRADTYGYLR